MARRGSAIALVVLLLVPAVPLLEGAGANHDPAGPCHPRGCSAWSTDFAVGSRDELHASAYDAAHGHLFAASRRNGTLSVVSFDAADGHVLWNVTTAGPGTDLHVSGAALSPDGSTFVVAGDTLLDSGGGQGRGRDGLVVAYDAATGSVRWAAPYDGLSGQGFEDHFLAVATDGTRAYVSGYSQLPDFACNGLYGASLRNTFVAYDLTTGAMAWYGVDWSLRARALAQFLAFAPNGTLAFAGLAQDCGEALGDTVSLKGFDTATGALRWNRTFDPVGIGNDVPTLLQPGPDGQHLLLGAWSSLDSNYTLDLVSLDAFTGAPAWTQSITPETDGGDIRAVATSPDGAHVLVAFDDRPAAGYGSVIRLQLRDAADGAFVRETSYAGDYPSGDVPNQILYAPNGTVVYVTGGTGRHDLIAAFDTDLQLLWHHDDAQALTGPPVGAYLAPDALHLFLVGPADEPSQSWGHVYARNAPLIAPPERPDASASCVGNATVRVRWTPPADDGGRAITSYVVSRRDVYNGAFHAIATVDGANRSFDDPGRTLGWSYAYNVTAVNDVGVGVPSFATSGTCTSVPDAPGLTAWVPAGSTRVVLNWTPPASDGGSAVSRYVLYRGPSPGALAYWTDRPSYYSSLTDYDQDPGNVVYYAILARNSVGDSPLSEPVRVVIPGPPQPPQNVTAHPGAQPGDVAVAWDAPAFDGASPITAYRIARVDASGWRNMVTLPADARAWVDHSAKLLTSYRYVVYASNAAGESDGAWSGCTRSYPVGALGEQQGDACVLSAQLGRFEPFLP